MVLGADLPMLVGGIGESAKKSNILPLFRRTSTPDSSSPNAILPAQAAILPSPILGWLSTGRFGQSFSPSSCVPGPILVGAVIAVRIPRAVLQPRPQGLDRIGQGFDGWIVAQPRVRYLIGRHLRHGQGRLGVVKVQPLTVGLDVLRQRREHLIEHNWARSSINQMVRRIKHVFKWGTENELVSPEVYHALQAVSGLKRGRSKARETEPVRPVPDVHIEAIQPYVSRQVWAIIQLQLLTAARPGELVGLRPIDDLFGNRRHRRNLIRHQQALHWKDGASHSSKVVASNANSVPNSDIY